MLPLYYLERKAIIADTKKSHRFKIVLLRILSFSKLSQSFMAEMKELEKWQAHWSCSKAIGTVSACWT